MPWTSAHIYFVLLQSSGTAWFFGKSLQVIPRQLSTACLSLSCDVVLHAEVASFIWLMFVPFRWSDKGEIMADADEESGGTQAPSKCGE